MLSAANIPTFPNKNKFFPEKTLMVTELNLTAKKTTTENFSLSLQPKLEQAER